MKTPKLLITITCLVALAGCAATIHDMTRTQYIQPNFTADQLRSGGLSLFPVTAGAGQEGYRRPLGDFLNANLAGAVPGGQVLPWQAAMDTLNSRDLAATYQEVIEVYQRTSIMDRQRLRQLQTALGTKYALYCSLQDYSESTHTSYNFFTGINSKKTATVQAHCLVIDLVSGDVVQEIVGQAQSVAGDYEYNSPYEAYAAMIAQSVLSQLPGSTVTVAKPAPTKSVKQQDIGG
jgi:hypothetical protein